MIQILPSPPCPPCPPSLVFSSYTISFLLSRTYVIWKLLGSILYPPAEIFCCSFVFFLTQDPSPIPQYPPFFFPLNFSPLLSLPSDLPFLGLLEHLGRLSISAHFTIPPPTFFFLKWASSFYYLGLPPLSVFSTSPISVFFLLECVPRGSKKSPPLDPRGKGPIA